MQPSTPGPGEEVFCTKIGATFKLGRVKEVSEATVDKYLSVFKAFFNWCDIQGTFLLITVLSNGCADNLCSGNVFRPSLLVQPLFTFFIKADYCANHSLAPLISV
jgi:hypothetical protein